MVNPESKRKADFAESSGYLPQIRAMAKYPTAPVWWSRSSLPAETAILHNGTFVAVDTGSKTLCVTANHVYQKYISDLNQYEDIELQIGNVRVNLDQYLIDQNDKVDLATFHIPKTLITGAGINIHGARQWPPQNLVEGDIVILGGYPGLLREAKTGSVNSAYVTFIARVAQANESHSAVQLNIEESYWPDGSEGIPARSNLGGMSGGPIYRYISEPIEYLELAGFIYEAHTEFEIIFAKNASYINGSGYIAV